MYQMCHMLNSHVLVLPECVERLCHPVAHSQAVQQGSNTPRALLCHIIPLSDAYYKAVSIFGLSATQATPTVFAASLYNTLCDGGVRDGCES